MMLLFLLLFLFSLIGASEFLPEARRSRDPSTTTTTGSHVGGGDCPSTCLCNSLSRIVYCSRRGMTSLPVALPAGTVQLNVNGNVFASPTLRGTNFTGYGGEGRGEGEGGGVHLEHLYMSECGIEELSPGTFVDLAGLRWLDVSNNRIRILERGTFRGLDLEHLFLNGNRELRILPDSFDGMSTVGLYLHDCHLTVLEPDSLVPLRGELRYLWLNGNRLERLDRSLVGTFAGLHHIRLGSNPLVCNCDAVWVKDFYDDNEDLFRGAIPPSCSWPPGLKSRSFPDLDAGQFRCRIPMFSRVEAFFDESQVRLNCRATGDPAPSLYWIQPSGSTNRYSPPSDAEVQENEGELVVEQDRSSRQRGMYICIANNDAGNVTLTIAIPGPSAAPALFPSPSKSLGSGSEDIGTTGSDDIVSVKFFATSGVATSGKNWTEIPSVASSPSSNAGSLLSSPGAPPPAVWGRGLNSTTPTSGPAPADPGLAPFSSTSSFSLLEMLGTVLVTHVCTVVGCLATSWLCCRRGFKEKRDGGGVAIGTVRDSGKRSPEFAYWSAVGGANNGHLRFVDYLNQDSPIRR